MGGIGHVVLMLSKVALREEALSAFAANQKYRS